MCSMQEGPTVVWGVGMFAKLCHLFVATHQTIYPKHL